jgi:mono/diheme cytochrome c family protein
MADGWWAAGNEAPGTEPAHPEPGGGRRAGRAGWAAAAAGVLVGVSALAPALAGPEPVTFSNQIARLMQEHCQGCHRPADVAPFPLLSYADAQRERRKIRRMVETRKMPPWKPVPGFGDFVGSRRLADADIALLRAWVEAGAPEGDLRDLPPPRQFPDTWTLGAPDVVLTTDAGFAVPAGDRDLYHCFVVPTSFPEDRYLSAVEFVPGNRKIVHHVLTYLDTAGRAAALDAAEAGPGYTCFGGPGFLPAGGFGGWAPGAAPVVMPGGVGMHLPAGAALVVQVHYHHRGTTAERDGTRLGLHFATRPVDKRVRVLPVLNRGFVIPAGAERHVVRASYTLPPAWNLHAIAIAPHMHLLGREMKITAAYPDGTVRPLVWIDDWDFHWQGAYTFAAPVPLPGGTRIDVEAVYDNSARNRRNPNTPPRDTGWGEGTTDEMCIAFLRVTVDAEHLDHRPHYGRAATGRAVRRESAGRARPRGLWTADQPAGCPAPRRGTIEISPFVSSTAYSISSSVVSP